MLRKWTLPKNLSIILSLNFIFNFYLDPKPKFCRGLGIRKHLAIGEHVDELFSDRDSDSHKSVHNRSLQHELPNTSRSGRTAVPVADKLHPSMRLRQAKNQIPAGLDDDEDILKYNGWGPKNRVTTAANKATSPRTYQCDEYPPAQFNQLGNVQSALCIEWYQNSGTQAPLLSNLVNICKLQKGQKVLYRVAGGCPSIQVKREEDDNVKQSPPLRPRADSSTITLSGTNATLRNPNGDGSLTYIAVDLGALQDGHYNLGVSLGGSVDNVTVLDSDGNTYANVDAPSGTTVQFTFDVSNNGSYVPFVLIAYTENAVNVSYAGNATVVASPTATNSGVRIASGVSLIIGLIIAIVL
ncbi:hypothetical protein OIDMADRAFT_51385 [Oidiodendron maius Zn]|uniref:Deoxyribonuclease NucA/NucB domain-containing protein n=1 Tax=Oidiodendron maius (strain Zn) TaxID=913774 RepID=A0A0C3HM44_OIDMZ|nr:hypothetical protein OIDMADRAFT_51385 [Oidiodendron maius Zn]